MSVRHRAPMCMLAFGLWACPANESAPKGEPSSEPPAPASKPAAAAPASAPAAAAAANPCFAAYSEAGDGTTVTIAGATFTRKGTTLRMAADEDSVTTLGVVGNLKEYSEENAEALEAYRTFFTKKNVDAVVVTGDVGETAVDIKSAFEDLAKIGKPVFAIAGNRENGDDFAKAAAAVDGVIDMNQVRLAVLDDHALVSVPGYHDPNYVHAERGCVHGAKELAEVAKAIDGAGAPVVVVSHAPTKQTGEAAIDVMSEGDHVGSAALTALLGEKKIKFMIASNIQESGGRASNADGSKAIEAGKMTDEMFFNPGGADRTVAWKMRDGKFAYGMVGVVTLDGAQAKYELMKLPNPEE